MVGTSERYLYYTPLDNSKKELFHKLFSDCDLSKDENSPKGTKIAHKVVNLFAAVL